jgi:hypothetical protein
VACLGRKQLISRSAPLAAHPLQVHVARADSLAKISVSDKRKSSGFKKFPNTLCEGFPVAFGYGNGMVLKRIFLFSVDSAVRMKR